MASENKYSVEITVKSGDRVLTQLVYPGQSKMEIIGIQSATAMALLKAGFDQAVLAGDEVPPQLAELFGTSVAGKPAK